MRRLEARYGRLHNISMAAVAAVLVVLVVPRLSPSDPRFVLNALLVAAMAFYAWLGARRVANREPQVVVDHDGILLGFGRNKKFTWDDIEWVRLRRLGFRPQLQLGIRTEAFIAADLRLSVWVLDDGLRPIRGMPSAVAVRDNGLDTRASAMLDAVKSFRPNLVQS